MGMTFAILRFQVPVENERFISSASGSEISCLRSLRILTGILKGPLPLFDSREEIQDMISVLLVGEIKKVIIRLSQEVCIGFRRERFFLSNICSYI